VVEECKLVVLMLDWCGLTGMELYRHFYLSVAHFLSFLLLVEGKKREMEIAVRLEGAFFVCTA
jgi:hypothetical protein